MIGDDETSYTRLADMSADNSLLTQYNNALDELFQKRGELPEDVIQSLAEMSAEEGLAYANALLSASDAEYSKYIQDLQEKTAVGGRNREKGIR